MSRLAAAAGIAIVLAAVVAGCGSHHGAAKKPAHASSRQATAAHRRPLSRLEIEKILSRGGELPDTCPKSIAANCVPGRMEGAIVCVGRKGRVARTPTMGDFRRMDAEAAKAQRERREGKKPKPPKRRRIPATLSLHRLPSGREVGTCNYGSGPPPVPSPSSASIAANE